MNSNISISKAKATMTRAEPISHHLVRTDTSHSTRGSLITVLLCHAHTQRYIWHKAG